ncbi:MAG TPA: amino acid adenylation domain-containing protein [Albitalea sp.]|nr:amino acid adenylation domain-containing protein [Albitalea sp.]
MTTDDCVAGGGAASTLGDAAADTAAAARQRLLALRKQQRLAAASGIPTRPASLPPLLSFAQEGLWFIDQLEGANAVYNSAAAWRISGPLEVTVLEEALHGLVARHESLRTGFEVHEGVPRPVIHSVADVAAALRLDDVARAAPQDVDAWLQAVAEAPFDLSRAPLLRARLLRLAETEHVFVVVVHHIVFDGWSMSVLARELGALYRPFGDQALLPPPVIQFADYAAWQRGRQASEPMQAALHYWREQLRGIEPIDLPTDHARPTRSGWRGALHRFSVPAAWVPPLHALAQRENVTLFMLLLAAFEVLLMRHARQHDISVGIPIAGRQRAELEGLIGCFVNTLVMREDLSGNPPFTELLARVRRTALEAYANQELPFDRLVVELSPQRDLARNPLYQVSFALDNQPEAALQLEGLQLHRIELPHTSSKFDLSLALSESGGVLRGTIEYSTELFDGERIARLAREWCTLLEAVVADPAQRIEELPLLDAAQRRRILVDFNRSEGGDGLDRCLHELVEAQVLRSPQAIAASCGERSLRYRELDAQANRLARALRGLGVGPEVLVAVCLERSLSTLVAVLGVLKAGGAWVPLDPDQPPARLAAMLDDCAASVIVTQQALCERLAASTARRVCLDGDAALLDAQADTALESFSKPEHLACVIYTSGSTGEPKGVQLMHRGFAQHLRWFIRALRVTPADRFLFKTSVGFDASIVEMLAPLIAGASVTVAEALGERDMRLLGQSLSRHAITVLQMVPSVLRAWLAESSFTAPPALRILVCGGEALDRELARELRRRLPGVRLGNFYGPTETSIDAAWHEVHEVPSGPGLVPIGRPVAHARCHVLDAQMQPVPIGVVGELCIGGAGLARGYLHRPELTAGRFVADPFHAGERLYRSGDLARYLHDGTLEWIGRLDEQVKLRGLRIELGEIDAALQACPGVAHAAVLLREDRPGHPRLVAYVAGEGLVAALLRGHLAQRLPDYMLPSVIVVLPALPLLPSGKLDRQALPAPRADSADSKDDTPNSPLEAAMQSVWCDVLGVDRVGVDDDFFELGGHSLLAIRLLAEIERRLGPALRVSSLFQAPTVRRLAALIETQPDAAIPSSCVVAMQARGDRPALFAVSGYGGGVTPFKALARELGDRQPLYVLDTGVFGSDDEGLTLEDVAHRMVVDMRRVQASGPYRLVGYSLGGKIVYEMAQQLHRAGERVALLALLDCAGPGYPRRAPFALRALLHLRHGLTLRPRAALGYFVERLLNLRKYALPAEAPLFEGESAGMAPAQAMQQSADAIDRAWRRYVPRAYPDAALLVRAELRPSHVGLIADDPLMGWGPLVGGGLRLDSLHCGHREMLNPENAAGLARVLARHLNESQGR